jgi:hypothetical protein
MPTTIAIRNIPRNIKTEQAESLDDIMQFAGISDRQFGEKTVQKLTAEKRKKYAELQEDLSG